MGDYVSAAIVAMAIGAIAGGQMILSRVDVPTGEASVAAHTLPAPAQALIGAPEAAKLHAQPVVEFAVVESAVDSGADNRLGAAANESSTNPKVVEPTGIANPLTEISPNDVSVKVATLPSTAAASAANKTTNNRRVARHAEPRVAR